MSLILKGIDIPKGTDGLSITFHSQDGVTETHILDATQAVQIPKGHGRMIDGDWIKYNLENYSDLPTKYLHMDLVREAIEDAPTILEEEE